MAIWDRIILFLTGLIAIYLIYFFVQKQKGSPKSSNIYYIISFAVLLVSGLLLIGLGWGILAHKLIAIVATLIPFSLAIGIVAQLKPDMEKSYLGLMIIGLVLIAVTRLADMTFVGKVVYPLFHATAGLTIFFLPILAAKKGEVKGAFTMVSVGGALIGIGGIALAFLKAGKQLLFFSNEVVLMILAPLLFLTALFFCLGFVKGD